MGNHCTAVALQQQLDTLQQLLPRVSHGEHDQLLTAFTQLHAKVAHDSPLQPVCLAFMQKALRWPAPGAQPSVKQSTLHAWLSTFPKLLWRLGAVNVCWWCYLSRTLLLVRIKDPR